MLNHSAYFRVNLAVMMMVDRCLIAKYGLILTNIGNNLVDTELVVYGWWSSPVIILRTNHMGSKEGSQCNSGTHIRDERRLIGRWRLSSSVVNW